MKSVEEIYEELMAYMGVPQEEIDDLEANVGNEITEGTETAEGDQQTKDRDLEEVS